MKYSDEYSDTKYHAYKAVLHQSNSDGSDPDHCEDLKLTALIIGGLMVICGIGITAFALWAAYTLLK